MEVGVRLGGRGLQSFSESVPSVDVGPQWVPLGRETPPSEDGWVSAPDSKRVMCFLSFLFVLALSVSLSFPSLFLSFFFLCPFLLLSFLPSFLPLTLLSLSFPLCPFPSFAFLRYPSLSSLFLPPLPPCPLSLLFSFPLSLCPFFFPSLRLPLALFFFPSLSLTTSFCPPSLLSSFSFSSLLSPFSVPPSYLFLPPLFFFLFLRPASPRADIRS